MSTHRIPKKSLLAGIVVIALLLLAFIFWNPFSSRAQNTIGVMLPLSGDAATLGQPTLQGIQLAVQEENQRRPQNDQISLNVQDTQARPELAINAYTQLVQNAQPSVMIGPLTSRESVALLPRLDQGGVPVISPGASSSELDRRRDLFFRVELSDSSGGAAEARIAYEGGARSVAILYISDEYGQGLERVFRERFAQLGGRVVLSVPFAPGESEYRPILQRVANSEADTLFIVGIEEIVNIVRQARQLRLRQVLLTTPIFENPTYLERLGPAAENVRLVRYGAFDVATYGQASQTAPAGRIGHDFGLRYRRQFGAEPTYYSALGYDAARLAIAAINQSGGAQPANVATYLRRGVTIQGASGTIRLDAYGDVEKPVSLVVVENGRFVTRR